MAVTASARGRLIIETRRLGDAAILAVSGELDVVAVPTLRPAIEQMLPERVDLLVLDLTEVQFLGTAGLKALLDIRDLAADRGVMFRVVVDEHRAVARPPQVTGLDSVLPISATLHEALGFEAFTLLP